VARGGGVSANLKTGIPQVTQTSPASRRVAAAFARPLLTWGPQKFARSSFFLGTSSEGVSELSETLLLEACLLEKRLRICFGWWCALKNPERVH